MKSSTVFYTWCLKLIVWLLNITWVQQRTISWCCHLQGMILLLDKVKSRILKHRGLSVCLQSGTSLLETGCKSCMPSGDAAFPAAWCVVASRQQEGSDRERQKPQSAVRLPWGQGSHCTLSLISSISSCFRCWCLNLPECYTNGSKLLRSTYAGGI